MEEIACKLGVAEATSYRCKTAYGAVGVTELRGLRQLRDENRKLEGLVAGLSLDKMILQVAYRRKW